LCRGLATSLGYGATQLEISLGLRPIARSLRTAVQATRYGRPTGEISNREYVSRHPELWRGMVREPEAPPTAGRRFGPTVANFKPIAPRPELGVAFVPHGTVLGREGWVLTHNGLLLTDCAWPRRPETPRTLPETLGKARHLQGTCLNLTTDWGSANYAHFLLDGLGRYALCLHIGMDPKDVDHIYCSTPDSVFTRNLMERVGIPLNKCIWSNEEPQITADMVFATSYPGSLFNYPKWLLDFLRGARRPSGEGAKRIYVPRGKERNISNQRDILELARSFGFVVYDYTKAAGHDFFADAEIIMGPHGAGLANAVFAPAGCQLLDILPSDMTLPFYRAISEPIGVHYNYLVGESEEMRPPGVFGPSPYNFWVEPEHVREALATLTVS
jgi:hypothetical protein